MLSYVDLAINDDSEVDLLSCVATDSSAPERGLVDPVTLQQPHASPSSDHVRDVSTSAEVA